MDQKTFNGWMLFLAALACGLQAVSTWCDVQQLKISRQQQLG